MRTDDDIRARLEQRLREVMRSSSGTATNSDVAKFTDLAVRIVCPVVAGFVQELREEVGHLRRQVLLLQASARRPARRRCRRSTAASAIASQAIADLRNRRVRRAAAV